MAAKLFVRQHTLSLDPFYRRAKKHSGRPNYRYLSASRYCARIKSKKKSIYVVVVKEARELPRARFFYLERRSRFNEPGYSDSHEVTVTKHGFLSLSRYFTFFLHKTFLEAFIYAGLFHHSELNKIKIPKHEPDTMFFKCLKQLFV